MDHFLVSNSYSPNLFESKTKLLFFFCRRVCLSTSPMPSKTSTPATISATTPTPTVRSPLANTASSSPTAAPKSSPTPLTTTTDSRPRSLTRERPGPTSPPNRLPTASPGPPTSLPAPRTRTSSPGSSRVVTVSKRTYDNTTRPSGGISSMTSDYNLFTWRLSLIRLMSFLLCKYKIWPQYQIFFLSFRW